MLVQKNTLNTIRSSRRKLCSPKSRYIQPKACPSSSSAEVIMDYVTAYSTFLCNPEDIKTCVDTMVLPPVYEQLRIVQNLQMIHNSVDLEGLDAVVMKLLIAHDAEAVESLLHSLNIFQQSRDVINTIIRYSYEISDGQNIGLNG